MYTKIIFGMVHSVLFECFCVEGGEREEIFRERAIEIVERLFLALLCVKEIVENTCRGTGQLYMMVHAGFSMCLVGGLTVNELHSVQQFAVAGVKWSVRRGMKPVMLSE